MITIGKYIVQKLGSISAFTNKVFPMIAPQGATMPFVTYRRASTSVEYTNDGSADDETSVTFMVVGSSYIEAVEMADTIRSTFEGIRDSYSVTGTSVTETIYVTDCEVTDIQDEYVMDQDCYVTTIGLKFYSHTTTVTTTQG